MSITYDQWLDAKCRELGIDNIHILNIHGKEHAIVMKMWEHDEQRERRLNLVEWDGRSPLPPESEEHIWRD